MKQKREVWKIVIVYALFGSGWIIFSDNVLNWFLSGKEEIIGLSIFKGLLFILTTSALLFVLIARLKAKIERSAQALLESEERFKFLVENSSDCVVIVGLDGIQRYVSQGAYRLFGFSPEELQGRRLEEIIHPDDLAAVMVQWETIVEQQERIPVTVQYRHVHKNGSWVDCEAAAQGFLHEPDINGVIASVRDISQRKQAELALKERNNFINTVLDNLPIGLAVNYIDEGKAAYMNVKFQEIYGWPEKDLKDISSFFRLVYPDPAYRNELKTRIFKDIASGNPDRMQWDRIEVTRSDGSTATVSARNIPLPEQNLMISTVQDITAQIESEHEKKLLREQLLHSQKMEAIGRLAGGVAHDFNNMLGVIIGYSELALEEVGDEGTLSTAIKEIHQAAQRSASLTRQLLAFARKQAITPKVLDLNRTISNMLDMLRRLIGEDISLSWSPHEAVGAVKMDPSQIDQILTNLCVNARDAIDGVGTIAIETRVASVDEHHAGYGFLSVGDHAVITVRDNGKGIDTAMREHIFEPFYTTKQVGEGTGLGLATVYGIVRQNNGWIDVVSEPGQGTSFTIYLPMYLEPAEPAEQKNASGKDAAGTGTLLLVEDEPMVLQMTTRMIERAGYKVLGATTAKQALQLAERHGDSIDVLMTDVVMPEMNGQELARRIQAGNPRIKCLFMSGYAADTIVQQSIETDGSGFLPKPFTTTQLAAALRQLLTDAKA